MNTKNLEILKLFSSLKKAMELLFEIMTPANICLVGCMGEKLLFYWKRKCDKNLIEQFKIS
jgi:hypothetical protein